MSDLMFVFPNMEILLQTVVWFFILVVAVLRSQRWRRNTVVPPWLDRQVFRPPQHPSNLYVTVVLAVAAALYPNTRLALVLAACLHVRICGAAHVMGMARRAGQAGSFLPFLLELRWRQQTRGSRFSFFTRHEVQAGGRRVGGRRMNT